MGQRRQILRSIFRKRVVEREDPPASSTTSHSRPGSGEPSAVALVDSSSGSDQLTIHENAQSHWNQSLWDRAYEALGKNSPDLVTEYQDLLAKEAQSMDTASNGNPLTDGTHLGGVSHDTAKQFDRAKLVAICNSGLARMDEKKVKYVIGGLEIAPREQIAKVAGLVLWAKDVIGQAVKASPEASIAWAGVCIILPLLTNAKAAQDANSDGFSYVTARMRYYTALEPLVQRLGDSSDVSGVLDEANESIIDLYRRILDFQVRSVLRFYNSHLKRYVEDAIQSQDWKQMKAKIDELETAVHANLSQISELVTSRTLHSLDKTSEESFQKLKQLLSVSEQLLRATEDHRNIAQEHQNIALKQLSLQEEADEREREKERRQCHQLFRLTSGDKDTTYEWYKDRVEIRVDGTCLWFLTHTDFQRWLEQASGPLLVSADPGCGKSVLAKYLVDHGLPRTNICYFFFKDQDQNTVRQALCALLHQLFSQNPLLIKHAISAYRNNGAGLVNATASLWEIFDSAVRDPQAGTVIIVLDALDECAELDFKYLIQHVKRQFQSNQPSDFKLKFLLTSRPYNQIVSEFRGLLNAFPRVHIPGEEHSGAISQEVNLVIKYRVDRLDLSSHVKEHLTKKLLEVSHRTYLWVYLVFDHLETEGFKKTAKGAETAIATLPKNVNEAYNRILEKSKNLQEARKALAIILAANRPLTLSEMNIAVNIQENHQSLHDVDLENENDFKSSLRSWCGLFISVYKGKVYFLHQTAREFLLADLSSPPTTVSSELRWHRSVTYRDAHAVLAKQCILFLNLFNCTVSCSYLRRNAFFDYSAKNWGIHFREADIADNDPLLSFTLGIGCPRSGSYAAWFDIYWRTTSLPPPANSTIFFVPSYFGHEAVVKMLLATEKPGVDSKDLNNRTPLSYAAAQGYDAIVRLLLETGKVEIDSGDTDGRTPLSWAAVGGHEAVVKLLLASGKVDINSRDVNDRTPLSYAAAQGYQALVILFLATRKADVNLRDIFGWTPLSWAASEGRESALKLLLETGKAEADMPDNSGQTPLSWAAESRHEAVVKMLLETGKVDVNSRDANGQTSLLLAAGRGHEVVVKLLLETGKVDVNLRDANGQTPLSLAAGRGDEAVVKLLLETGKVDVDSRDAKGQTSLSLAADRGYEAVVKLLKSYAPG